MFGAIFGKIISPIMPYLLGGAAVAVLTLGGLYYWKSSQYDKLAVDAAAKIERATANAAQLEQAVAEQGKALSDMAEAHEKDMAATEARTAQLASLQKSLDEERRKNEDYKKRWLAISAKKPGLLSRRINDATAQWVRRLAAATCRADCDADGNQSGRRQAPPETGTNPDR